MHLKIEITRCIKDKEDNKPQECTQMSRLVKRLCAAWRVKNEKLPLFDWKNLQQTLKNLKMLADENPKVLVTKMLFTKNKLRKTAWERLCISSRNWFGWQWITWTELIGKFYMASSYFKVFNTILQRYKITKRERLAVEQSEMIFGFRWKQWIN